MLLVNVAFTCSIELQEFFWISARVGGCRGGEGGGKFPVVNLFAGSGLGNHRRIKDGRIVIVLEFQSSNVTL